MELDKLSTANKVIAVSGIVLLIVSFFTWFEPEVAGVDVNQSDSAWGFTLGTVGVILGVVLVILVALPAFGVDLPPALRNPVVFLVIGALAFVAILLTVLFASYEFVGVPDDAVDTSRKLGAWLGLAASVGLLVGVILKRKSAVPPASPAAPPAA